MQRQKMRVLNEISLCVRHIHIYNPRTCRSLCNTDTDSDTHPTNATRAQIPTLASGRALLPGITMPEELCFISYCLLFAYVLISLTDCDSARKHACQSTAYTLTIFATSNAMYSRCLTLLEAEVLRWRAHGNCPTQ